ncbi:PAS domain-containing protein, partial [bacterium]|nr:PAS domain-containing protein [bacterium]
EKGLPLINKEETLTDNAGNTMWIETHRHPIKNEEGEVIGIVGTMVDITERKEIEKVLQASEEKFKTMAEFGNDWEYWIDTNSKFIYVSPAVKRITGYSPQEFYDDTDILQKIIHPEDIFTFSEHQHNSIDDKIDAIDFRIITKKGETRWIGHACQEIVNAKGKRLGRRGSNRDITERIHLEDDLKGERKKLASILEGANVGTWEWNVKSGETIFSERWANIIDYTLEELSPISIETWLKFVHPDDLKKSRELLDKHFKGELDYYKCEIRMLHKNGNWVWVLDRGKVMTWTNDGKPLMMFGTHSDITDRIQAEIDKHKMEKIKGVVEMAGAAAHELNQPMQSILMLSEYISLTMDKSDPNFKNIEKISQGIKRLGKLTKKIQLVATESSYSTKDYIAGEKIVDLESV